MSLLTTLAGRFVAGEHAPEAIETVKHLNEQGLSVTLNFLGEEVLDRAAAARARDEYVSLLEGIRLSRADANVSIKLTQLGFALGDDVARENLSAILKEAAKGDIFVRIDMEGSGYTQRTLDLQQSLAAEFPNSGVVIQASLKRSPADVEALNARGVRVRLCKGAYKEPAEVAHLDREEVNRAYDAMARTLLEKGTYPAFATHDDERIEAVQAAAAQLGLAKDRYEFQMLLGLRPKLWHHLLDEGHKVRVYVPYGTHCVGYLWRRLRERKENLLFVARSLVKG